MEPSTLEGDGHKNLSSSVLSRKKTDPSAPQSELTEHIFAVEINTQEIGDSAFFLQDTNGNIFSREADLEKWGFTPPHNPPIIHNDIPYYSLKEFKDLVFKINEKEMAIYITSPSSHFKLKEIEFSSHSFVVPEEPPLGAYFNYDTLAQQNRYSQQIGGLFSGGVFNKFGTGSCNFLAQHSKKKSPNKSRVVRLNSSWEYDDPANIRSLILGDSYTAPGMWGNSVGFGGIQFQTNFGTQPTFITFPLPSAKGESAIPSVIDLYVNNSLIKQSRTEAGPFTINSIPVTTGGGNINFVATDLLGRQQEFSVPFYASTSLLKPGLQNYSYSAGFLRHNFGVQSNDYKRFAFVGDHAMGFTDSFTGGAHLELLEKQQTLGLGGYELISTLGVFNLAGALSNHSNKLGELTSIGFQRQEYNGISFGTNVQWTSKKFVQLGTCPRHSLHYQTTTFVGIPLYKGASLGISYLYQEYRKKTKISLLNMNFNQSISQSMSMNISGITNMGGKRNQSIFLTLTYALNETTSFNAIGTAQKDGNQGTAQLTRNLPVGPGYGYNLYAANGQQENYQASFTAQDDIGTYTAAGSHQSGITTGQIQAKGAVAFLNGNAHLTRLLGQSFAVVEVPGYSDIRIYSQNQYVGRTADDGTLLVPNLLPYQKNPLRVELEDLPLDAQVNVAEVNPIPYYLSGLVAKFPIKSSSGASMKLVLPSGEPVPVGAVVKMNKEKFPIGYEGQLYLTDLQESNELEVTIKNKTYICSVPYKKSKEILPDLGEIKCQERKE
jgi:outer membrane usher protein